MELITRLKNAVKAYDDAHNFTCDLCGRELFANERICAPCRKALPWNDGCVCPFCGRKIKEEGVCVECKAHPIGVKKALQRDKAQTVVHAIQCVLLFGVALIVWFGTR